MRICSSLEQRTNAALSIVGGLGLTTLTLIGAFPMTDELLPIHNAAAGITFTLTTVYSLMQLWLSRRLQMLEWFRLRAALAGVTSLSLVLMVTCLVEFGANNPSTASWSTALAEYTLVISTLVNFMTFALDFSDLDVDVVLFDRRRSSTPGVLILDN